jgi:hypothetical protein
LRGKRTQVTLAPLSQFIPTENVDRTSLFLLHRDLGIVPHAASE